MLTPRGLSSGGHDLVRRLIADTGAGTRQSVFQLVLLENDCLQCGGIPMGQVQLGGASSGSFPLYLVEVRIPQLNFQFLTRPRGPSGESSADLGGVPGEH
jgi:hypothetical protein